jgi:hypothetical protein
MTSLGDSRDKQSPFCQNVRLYFVSGVLIRDCHLLLVTRIRKNWLLSRHLVLPENLREITNNRRVLVIILRVSLNNRRVLPINHPLLLFVRLLYPLRAAHRESMGALPEVPTHHHCISNPIKKEVPQLPLLYINQTILL